MGFQEALQQVLKDEGGYIEIPTTGEVSNYGISLRFVQGVIDRQATKDFIKTLTLEAATQIYQEQFWLTPHIDQIKNDKLASLMFYLGVNCGTPTLAFMVQMACVTIGAKNKVDGFMGPKTVAVINSCDPVKLYAALCKTAEDRYRQIAQNPKQAPFLTGWLARLDRYRQDPPIVA